MNDRCDNGVCKGTYYGNQCADGLGCTDDICDGQGGCSLQLQSGYCKIANQCHKDGETDTGGCAICDTSKDTASWTLLPNLCKIGDTCYKPGDRDTTGCGTCDPTQSSSSWTLATDTCLIGGLCFQPGEKDATGCGTCDPLKDTSHWTAASGSCLIQGSCYTDGTFSPSGCGVCNASQNGTAWTAAPGATSQSVDFESGLGGFSVDPLVNSVGWQVATARARGGSSSLYYGSVSSGSYDNGAANQGGASWSVGTLAAGQKAALHFWLYLDTETADGFDVLTVKANSQVLWTKSATTVSSSSYRQWIPVEVDLTALAGQSVQISFHFDTVDNWSNTGEGVYIDDVALLTGC
jgi:hypothetical protein